jgi:hypothetical protein
METKTCPKCGKQMIRRYRDYILCTYPPQLVWYWWCGCGHIEPGGVEGTPLPEETAQQEWERANDAALPAPPA